MAVVRKSTLGCAIRTVRPTFTTLDVASVHQTVLMVWLTSASVVRKSLMAEVWVRLWFAPLTNKKMQDYAIHLVPVVINKVARYGKELTSYMRASFDILLSYGSCTAEDPYRLGIWCYSSKSERDSVLTEIGKHPASKLSVFGFSYMDIVVGTVLGTAVIALTAATGGAALAAEFELGGDALAISGDAVVTAQDQYSTVVANLQSAGLIDR